MTRGPHVLAHVDLVGIDGLCEACELRPAVGRSIGGSRVCRRCAGWAAVMADELREEVEASKARREQHAILQRPRITAALERLGGHENARAFLSPRTRARAGRGRDAAAVFNNEKARHAKVARETAVERALRKVEAPCSAGVLAAMTHLSIATIKRALIALRADGKVTSVRGRRKADPFLYSLVRVA